MATLLPYALTTVADVKESMGIASSDHSWDNLIIRKINQVTKQIEKYCGRRFIETAYTQEEYNSTQTDQLVLAQRPITSSTPFELGIRDSGLNTDSWDTIDTQLYYVDTESGVVDLLFSASGRWNRWRATYSAGYATIPEDLAEAAATLAAFYTQNAGGQAFVQEIKEGARSQRFFDTPSSFDNIIGTLGINEVIDSYANFPVILDR